MNDFGYPTIPRKKNFWSWRMD